MIAKAKPAANKAEKKPAKTEPKKIANVAIDITAQPEGRTVSLWVDGIVKDAIVLDKPTTHAALAAITKILRRHGDLLSLTRN